MYDGAALYATQVQKVRQLLSALMTARLSSRYGGGGAAATGAGKTRAVSSRQSLWYELVPRVVREISAGRTVHVLRLVDEAWSAAMARVQSDKERVADQLKVLAVWARPHPALSGHYGDDVLLRFRAFVGLARALAIRVAAAQLRVVAPAHRSAARVRAFVDAQTSAMDALLTSLAPCSARYTGDGIPVDAADAPLLCLQECRAHVRGHRGSRRVRGGASASIWAKVASLLGGTTTPVWAGPHEGGGLPSLDAKAVEATAARLVRSDPFEWLAALADVAEAYTGPRSRVIFAPLAGTARAPSTDAVPFPPRPGRDARLRLRAAPLDPAHMPYCLACCVKTSSSGDWADSAAARNSAGGADGSKGGGEREGWATSTFLEVVSGVVDGLLGRSSVADEDTAVSGSFAHAIEAQNAAGAANVQEIVFGLCGGCVEQGKSMSLIVNE